jgi:hypothetical protein
MSKSKQQGTTHETRTKYRILDEGIPADRLAEGGTYDAGDVWAVCPPSPTNPDRVALWWKRLAPLKPGQKNRRPDGEREVVVITPEFFLELLEAWAEATDGQTGVVIECKAAQQINVTRLLHNARVKLSKWKQAQR